MPLIRNLIFEGGGVKCLAYIGALKALAERDVLAKVRRVGGTSAGAIAAVVVGLGHTFEETDRILRAVDFKKLLDSDTGILRNSYRLLNDYGWNKGDYFEQWIRDIIGARTGKAEITFAELKTLSATKPEYRDLYFIGCNLSTGFHEVFSHEGPHQNMPIARAARISMSIPLIFASPNIAGERYTDGGLANNYPIKLFDQRRYLPPEEISKHAHIPDYYMRVNENIPDLPEQYVFNEQTLGFRLDTSEEIAVFSHQSKPEVTKINSFMGYARALVRTVLEVQSSYHLHSDDWQRTVYCDTLKVKTMDFSMSDENKNALIASGYECTKKYFAWIDGEMDSYAGHPARRCNGERCEIT